MKHLLFSLLAMALAPTALSQTYFYIDQIDVVPANPTTSDDVSIELVGNLSSSGSYIVSAGAQVNGSIVTLTVIAASTGGLTVLVPHTETISVGQLPAGDYTIAFTLNSFGILDGAPAQQHTFTVTEGDPCSNLDLVSVRWHAFSDTAIVVHVMNNSTALFDYPNFILFDAFGDTLAKETVNFFGIAGESWHLLRVMDGATVPPSPFNGTLELWTLFTEELACAWQMSFDLCPPEPCATFMPSMGNYGGALVLGTFNWSIFDAGGPIASGQFNLTETEQFDSDSICLPPGDYQMAVSPTGPPTGGAPMFFVTGESGYGTAPWPVAWSLPVLMPVDFYALCIDGTNAIEERDVTVLTARPTDQGLVIERRDGRAIGPVELFDAQGRLVHASFGSTDRLLIPMCSSGMHLLRTDRATFKVAAGMQ